MKKDSAKGQILVLAVQGLEVAMSRHRYEIESRPAAVGGGCAVQRLSSVFGIPRRLRYVCGEGRDDPDEMFIPCCEAQTPRPWNQFPGYLL